MRLPLIDGPGQFRLDGRRSAGGHALHRGAARRASPRRCSTTSTRTPSTSSRTTTSASRSRRSCRRASRTCWSTARGGIAVGMATNIPPHNLGEVIDACCALIDNPDLTIDAADGDRARAGFPDRRHHPRPHRHPRRLRARPRLADHARPRPMSRRCAGDREAIVVTEIPYQVNKARLIERIAEVVRDKRVEGISELRDESDRDGVRVVIELKRDADGRRGAEPALPLHAAADELRRQHAGARRRPAAS